MKKILLIIMVCSIALFAKTEQLIIDANEFHGDDKTGVSVFTGNVKIKKGLDKLNADKVDVYFKTNKTTKKKEPQEYIATGKVDFEIYNEDKHYVGKGDKVIYKPAIMEYVIIGNGFIKELNEKREIYGNKIYVNQIKGTARVEGDKKKPVRFITDIKVGEEK